MSNFIVVDLETSGLDPKTSSILSIGAVKRKGGQEFYGTCRIWEGAEIDPAALKINGFKLEQIMDPQQISETDLIKSFFRWAGGDFTLIGMNPYFDYSFLKAAADRAGIQKVPLSHRTIDLHSLAVAYAVAQGREVPSRGFYMDAIYAMLQLPHEPRPHNALTGAKMENQAFHKMFYSIVRR